MHKLLHYIPSIRFTRVHLNFINNNSITNYFIIADKNNLFKIKNKYVINDSRIKWKRDKQKIKQFIKKIKPDSILIAKNALAFTTFIKNTYPKIKIYFINHGIINNKSKELYFENNNDYKKGYNLFNGYFLNPYEKSIFMNMGIDEKKIHIINGTPQIDYLLSNDLDEKKNKFIKKYNIKNHKFILLLQNRIFARSIEREYPDLLAIKEYYMIINETLKFAEKYDYHLIIKLKGNGGGIGLDEKHIYLEKLKYIYKNDRITLLNLDNLYLLYDLLFADIVIIQTGGTSLIESFIINQKTIQCQILDHHNFIDIDKYNLLPQADDINKLNEWLLKFHNNYIFSDKYKKQINLFIEEYYGKIEKVTDKIVQKITNL